MTTLWWQYNIDWNKPEFSKSQVMHEWLNFRKKPAKGLDMGIWVAGQYVLIKTAKNRCCLGIH